MRHIQSYQKMFEVQDLTPDQIAKIKYFYHATAKDNLSSVMTHGIHRDKIEKVIYLGDSFVNAAKFLAVRGMIGNIVVFKIKADKLDKSKLSESFDHSYEFFQCRAFIYEGDIPVGALDTRVVMSY
jgi:hypothetical protein